jgi:hypothetical protein
MILHVPFHPALIVAAGTVVVFVAIKTLIELIPL